MKLGEQIGRGVADHPFLTAGASTFIILIVLALTSPSSFSLFADGAGVLFIVAIAGVLLALIGKNKREDGEWNR